MQGRMVRQQSVYMHNTVLADALAKAKVAPSLTVQDKKDLFLGADKGGAFRLLSMGKDFARIFGTK